MRLLALVSSIMILAAPAATAILPDAAGFLVTFDRDGLHIAAAPPSAPLPEAAIAACATHRWFGAQLSPLPAVAELCPGGRFTTPIARIGFFAVSGWNEVTIYDESGAVFWLDCEVMAAELESEDLSPGTCSGSSWGGSVWEFTRWSGYGYAHNGAAVVVFVEGYA